MATTPSNPLSKLFDTNGKATIYNSTVASSTTTGALIVTGGVGIGQNLWVNGPINLVAESSDAAKIYAEITATNNTNLVLEIADDTATDAVVIRHRHYSYSPLALDIATFNRKSATEGNIVLNGDVLINGYTSSTNTSSGSLRVVGGLGLSGNLNVNGTVTITNGIVGVGQSGTINLGDGSFTKTYGGSWTFNGGVTSTGAGFTAPTGPNSYQGYAFAGQSTAIISSSTNHINFVVNNSTVTDISQTTFAILPTTQTTNTNTGALIVSGGAAVGGNLAIGGYTYHNNLKTAHVYIKGTGLNNNGSNAFYINGAPVTFNSGQRGLTFFTIDKATLTATNYGSYDTYGTATSSTQLAALLNGMTNTQFGVLISYDAIESAINSTLITALAQKGLYKLAYGDHNGSRNPYAALFDATGSSAPARNVMEVWESNSANAPQAVIATYITTDGTAQGAGFQGNDLTNVLISGSPNQSTPVVSVDQGGGVTITGVTTVTNTTNAVSSLTGALVVSGGIGINKDAWIGGALYFSDGTSQTSAGVGSAIVQLVTLTNKVLPGNFITLPNTATYVVSTGTRVYMDVYVDGYILSKGYDYIESSTTAITTNMALPVGSTLEFRISRAI